MTKERVKKGGNKSNEERRSKRAELSLPGAVVTVDEENLSVHRGLPTGELCQHSAGKAGEDEIEGWGRSNERDGGCRRKAGMRFGLLMMYCWGVAWAGECVNTRQRPDLVSDRVIEVDTGDEEDEDNSHDLDCRELMSTGECVNTQQRPDLVAGRAIEVDTSDKEDEDNNHNLNRRELASAKEIRSHCRQETPTMMKTKTTVMILTTRSLCRQRKLDLVASRVIEAETPTMMKTKTMVMILTTGSLRRQRKLDLVVSRVIEAETPTTRKICGNDKLPELQGSRARMLWAGVNEENGECSY
ncbi:hypothetical protein ACLOJK_025194 [Asimina triloba]